MISVFQAIFSTPLTVLKANLLPFCPRWRSVHADDFLPTALGAHTAEFESQWVAAQGSWDEQAEFLRHGHGPVESKLKLDWEYASLELLNVDNEVPTMPLADGEVYTLSISLTSQETGEANYTCQDASNTFFPPWRSTSRTEATVQNSPARLRRRRP